MKILAVDTALGACSAAILDGTTVLARAHEDMQRGHAEALAPMVDRVMREAALPFAALDRLAVTTGPGTFTGQRVGLAFMRALRVALKKPLVGVTTLAVLSEEALGLGTAAWAVSACDAKRGELYLGSAARGGDGPIAPMLALWDDAPAIVAAAARAGNDVLLAGTGAERLTPLLRALGLAPQDSLVRQPDAVFVARLASRVEDPREAPRAFYLRAPDAKLPGAS